MCRARLMRCKAWPACQEEHKRHTCKFCGDRDSNHRSDACPKKPKRCLAWPACQEHHSHHTCKFCGDANADHKSTSCPHKPRAKDRCKAWPDCQHAHTHHVCLLCGDPDADHRSDACPARVQAILYHGTDGKHAASIRANGILASKGGRLGPGVYATTNKKAAKAVARTRFPGNPIVVTLQVDLGRMRNCYDVDIADGSNSWQGRHYDTAYARHPPWAGNDDGLREYIIPDAARCKVLDIVPV